MSTSTISFSGTGSGLPVSDWIDALMQVERQPVNKLYTQKDTLNTSKTTLNTVESKMSSLRSAIEKLTDGNLATSFDLFGKRSATTSDSTAATATATNKASVQSIQLKVDTLATATTAKSVDGSNPANVVDGTQLITSLGNKQGTAGKFSIFTNNVRHEFTVSSTSTLNSVMQDINNANLGITASIVNDGSSDNGKFKLTLDSNTVSSIKMGANGDTSNFLNVTQLSTADTSGTDIMSVNALSAVDSSGTVVGTANLAGGIQSGTFTIGKAQFTIDANTTFDDLIGQINASKDSGVVASYDVKTNKLMLTSKDPGKVAITLGDASNDPFNNTSNFLTKMGLIDQSGDSLTSQTLGTNAKVYLNGSSTALEATSNTLTSDVTGIAGVTINLLSKPSDSTKPVSLNVNQNTDDLVNAVGDFISKFNDLSSNIDSSTSSTGGLKNDYTLTSMKNNLRQSAMSNVSGLSKYDSLAMIGITTGSVGTSVKTSTTSLQLDKDKFLAALADNPSQVRTLLLGDKSKGVTGVMQQLESKVESSLDPVNGYFQSESNSLDSRISDIDKSITKGEDRLTSVKKQYTDQFNQMDTLISQMKSQSSYLSSI